MTLVHHLFFVVVDRGWAYLRCHVCYLWSFPLAQQCFIFSTSICFSVWLKVYSVPYVSVWINSFLLLFFGLSSGLPSSLSLFFLCSLCFSLCVSPFCSDWSLCLSAYYSLSASACVLSVFLSLCTVFVSDSWTRSFFCMSITCLSLYQSSVLTWIIFVCVSLCQSSSHFLCLCL